jgi:U3 small nucleolar RNA-associated protein 20
MVPFLFYLMILLVWVAIKLVILFDWTGIRRVIKEAVKKPTPYRESGVELLLYNIVKGYSSRFHSKAEGVLQLLTSEAIFHIGDGADQGKLVL